MVIVMAIHAQDRAALASVKAKIELDAGRHFSIDELALQAGMSKTKFKLLFKQYFGIGPYCYFREQRLQQALLLLRDGDEDIKIIAHRLGFKTLSSFSKAVKKRFGVGPRGVRREGGS